jgi:hypothetical protein
MSNDSGERSPAPFGFRYMAPLVLGATLNPINSTMISTAIVPIADSLHASIAEAGWLIAVLYLTSAIAQPTMGRLVDLFGPRRIFLISLFLVAAAGVFGRLASSLTALVMVRVLLGIGTSAAYPAAMRIFRVQSGSDWFQAAACSHGCPVAGRGINNSRRPPDGRGADKHLWLALDLHRQCAPSAADCPPGPAVDSEGSAARGQFSAPDGRVGPDWHRAFYDLPFEPDGFPDES